MNERRMRVTAFLVALALGFALYLPSFLVPGHPEPWDLGNGSSSVYFGACLLVGLALGLAFPRFPGVCYLGS